MRNIKTILMGGVAAVSLATVPALAQEPQTGAAGVEQTAQAPAGRSFDETYGQDHAAWGDRAIGELVGTEVVNDAGETIGQIDDFGLAGEDLVAIVGIGGFLGIGTHQVAVPLDQLSAQGEQLLLAGVTREQLEEMPEYDEQQTQTFAQDQTLRGGYEGSGTGDATNTAAMTPSESPANDQPMQDVEEEVAQAAEQSGDATGDAADEVAQATEGAADDAGDAGQEVAQGAEQTVEPVTEEAGGEAQMAGTGTTEPMTEETETVEVEPAVEQPAEGTDVAESNATDRQEAGGDAQMAETETTEPMTEETETVEAQPADQQPAEGTDVAEGGAADQQATEEPDVVAESEEPMDGEQTETVQVTEEPMDTEAEAGADAQVAETESQGGWTDEMQSIFADIADRQIEELVGMDVASADGEVVGQVDNFALEGEDVVAIVGVGGFLGIGQHDVALPLGEMTYDGERLVLSSITEEQLNEMPEYDSDQANRLPGDGTLRSTYDQ